MLLAGGGIKGSKEAGGGTERSEVSSGTFASVSKDRGSNEVEGTVDSLWLVITSGKSTGEGSRATGRPGEATFMLRKAVRRVWSLRREEGDLVFFLGFSKTAGNGRLPLVSEQKLKEKAFPMLNDILTTSPLVTDAWQMSKHCFPIDW